LAFLTFVDIIPEGIATNQLTISCKHLKKLYIQNVLCHIQMLIWGCSTFQQFVFKHLECNIFQRKQISASYLQRFQFRMSKSNFNNTDQLLDDNQSISWLRKRSKRDRLSTDGISALPPPKQINVMSCINIPFYEYPNDNHRVLWCTQWNGVFFTLIFNRWQIIMCIQCSSNIIKRPFAIAFGLHIIISLNIDSCVCV